MFWKTPTVTIRGNKFDAYQLDAYWKGMEDEQDRIIKLLEDQIRKSNNELEVVNGQWYPAYLKLGKDIIKAIELIKGENK